jgi:hypothetical protein
MKELVVPMLNRNSRVSLTEKKPTVIMAARNPDVKMRFYTMII